MAENNHKGRCKTQDVKPYGKLRREVTKSKSVPMHGHCIAVSRTPVVVCLIHDGELAQKWTLDNERLVSASSRKAEIKSHCLPFGLPGTA